jgi:4-amino-4-deoxy-L-arabinose transferase-like glycosyltransferase
MWHPMLRDLEASLGRNGMVLLVASLATGFLTHAYNLFEYPLYLTDEGIYLQQAWSVMRQMRLSPYTYVYDHAPGGWVMIAAWMTVLPAQFETFGNALNTGRILMLLVHVANVFLLFEFARRLSGSLLAAFITCFFFNVSPLAVFYQREVLLDNLMVFWLLLSLYLVTRPGGRIKNALAAGMAFGIALVTKENVIFFAPVLLYLLYRQVQGTSYQRFAKSFWAFATSAPVSSYVLYAALKDELFPTAMDFNVNRGHVSLLFEIWWQLHRNQGSLFDRSSNFWMYSFDAWLPKDHFLLIGGGAAAGIGLLIGLSNRQKYWGFLVAFLLAALYGFYLMRGSVMLEFYIIPWVPFLALNLGMVTSILVQGVSQSVKAFAVASMIAVLVLPMGAGYVVGINDKGRPQLHDLYRLPLTEMQAEQLAWVRHNIPPGDKIIIDDDIWMNLHDVRPYYPFAHSHWKASGDPDVRDKLFHKDWQQVDYIVMSNKMRTAMINNNGAGNEQWILDALDHHSHRVWDLHHGDVDLQVYQIDRTSGDVTQTGG